MNTTFVRINFSSSELKWFPASVTSDFRIEYEPQGLTDGEHTLLIEATDETGNASGDKPYEVTFLINDETMLTFKSVFPNPSSSDFFFQFLLTGNVLPDYFSLQIFTSEGKLVQKFSDGDMIDFKLGINEMIWQARDLSGSLLPNGMYLYRMKINVKDKELNQQGKLMLIK